jgi:hypothetical protein
MKSQDVWGVLKIIQLGEKGGKILKAPSPVLIIEG